MAEKFSKEEPDLNEALEVSASTVDPSDLAPVTEDVFHSLGRLVVRMTEANQWRERAKKIGKVVVEAHKMPATDLSGDGQLEIKVPLAATDVDGIHLDPLTQRRIEQYTELEQEYAKWHPDVLNNPFTATIDGMRRGTIIPQN